MGCLVPYECICAAFYKSGVSAVTLQMMKFGALGVSVGLITLLGSLSDRSTIAQPVPSPTASASLSPSNPAYVPLPNAVITAMLKLAGVTREDVVYSLGSGDGRVAIAAVKDYGARRSVVVEANAASVQSGTTNAQQAGVGDRTQFLQQEPLQADLREASVVNLDALPNVPLKLRAKLLSELKPGTRMIARTAILGDWKPDQTTTVAGTTLYYWVVPERLAGDWQGRVEFAPGRSNPIRFGSRSSFSR